jgi:hypothetical protein
MRLAYRYAPKRHITYAGRSADAQPLRQGNLRLSKLATGTRCGSSHARSRNEIRSDQRQQAPNGCSARAAGSLRTARASTARLLRDLSENALGNDLPAPLGFGSDRKALNQWPEQWMTSRVHWRGGHTAVSFPQRMETGYAVVRCCPCGATLGWLVCPSMPAGSRVRSAKCPGRACQARTRRGSPCSGAPDDRG